jgi:two-component system, NtrC family, sensor kinase
VQSLADSSGTRLLVGYAFVENTPFILMICKQEEQLMMPWRQSQLKIFWFLAISVALGLLVILGVSTYLVGQIHEADQKRVATLHQVEYSNKMASIGRLAAGVAHEINNPLAIINEKAGLIKDLFTFKQAYQDDPRLIALIDSIIQSVDRCAAITKRLLNFARHLSGDSSIQDLSVGEVIEEVLGFLEKEAAYRRITVKAKVPEGMPTVRTDRGKLQQILLNMFNNAFAAVKDGGHLEVSVRLADRDHFTLNVADDGCGIPETELEKIFEPFFSTKTKQGGTGLGLSITYSLIQELGGQVAVKSAVGKGTTFMVTLPFALKQSRGDANAGVVGG